MRIFKPRCGEWWRRLKVEEPQSLLETRKKPNFREPHEIRMPKMRCGKSLKEKKNILKTAI